MDQLFGKRIRDHQRTHARHPISPDRSVVWPVRGSKYITVVPVPRRLPVQLPPPSSPKSVIPSEVRRQPNAAKDLCVWGKIVRVHVGFCSRAQDLVPTPNTCSTSYTSLQAPP